MHPVPIGILQGKGYAFAATPGYSYYWEEISNKCGTLLGIYMHVCTHPVSFPPFVPRSSMILTTWLWLWPWRIFDLSVTHLGLHVCTNALTDNNHFTF